MSLTGKRFFFWAVLVLWTLLALGLIPLYFGISLIAGVSLEKATRFAIWWYGRIFFFLMHPIIPFTVRHAERSTENAPCILVANHQSFLDIYLLCAQRVTNLCFVVRAWPFKTLFFFAPFMRISGYIETEGPAKERDFIRRCKAVLDSGATIVCFPEGTRSKDGRLGPFYTGIFRAAVSLDATIVPLVFHNTGKVCPPGKHGVYPQPLFVELLDPIRASSLQESNKPHLRLRDTVKDRIEAALKSRNDEKQI